MEVERNVQNNLNYVRSDDFAEPEPVEVFYGMVHTDETLAELDRIDNIIEERGRQALAAEAARPDADEYIEYTTGTERQELDDGTVVETAKKEKVKFSIPVEKFRHIEVDTPNVVQERDDVAITYTNVEERDVQKTGLVCPDCLKDDDVLIWGPDK